MSTFLNKNNILIAVIFIFHAVGLVGFLINPNYFTSLSPLNLLLSAVLVLVAIKPAQIKLYIVILLVALFGFIIEIVGVETKLIFGSYYYGNSFGLKLLGVPLLIGVNWAFLLYSIAQFCTFKNKYVNVLFSSTLMIFLDFFIEQNASRYDFWYWENNIIPMQNYIAWFLISVLLNLFFFNTFSKTKNVVAKYFYLIQLLFFCTLFFINLL